jgi:hypothetical protein
MTSDDDKLVSPHELWTNQPHLGLRMQRNRRRDGTLPYMVIGTRIFYRESSIKKFLAEAEQRGGNDDA